MPNFDEQMATQVADAREFAADAHRGQMYGQQPYTAHLDAVVDNVRKYFPQGGAVLIAAYLHDVLEDTDVSYDELAGKFGGLVAQIVSLVSDEPGKNRQTRKDRTHQKLEKLKYNQFSSAPEASTLALVVKSADRLANVESSSKNSVNLMKMYRKEHPAFTAAVYRPGLVDDLWEKLNALIEGDTDE